MKPDDKEPHFLAHPEIEKIFESIGAYLNESDRGVVLISASYVDNQLDKLFREVAPTCFSRKGKDRLLCYPGALSSLSSKNDIAVFCRLIDPELGQAIDKLRRLRNMVAHYPSSFCLRDHWHEVKQIYNLGPGLPSAINRMALEFLLKGAVGRILKIEIPTREEQYPVFKNPQEVLDYLSAKPDLLDPLEDQAPRLELGIATAIICGLIVRYRESRDRTKQANGAAIFDRNC